MEICLKNTCTNSKYYNQNKERAAKQKYVDDKKEYNYI